MSLPRVLGVLGVPGVLGASGIPIKGGDARGAGGAGIAGGAAVNRSSRAAGGAGAADTVRAACTPCPLCPHACLLVEGQLGVCGARAARNGTVVAENYGRVTALALDPIEKKPLARFHPGSMILSVGSYGCNLACPFCQNSDIAQPGAGDYGCKSGSGFVDESGGNCGGERARTASAQKSSLSGLRGLSGLGDKRNLRIEEYTPERLAQTALDLWGRGNIGIAYTYNEPLVGYEFVLDTARLAHEAGLLNVIVSNGYLNEGPLQALLPHLDAANIDLKGFTQDFYDRVGAPCGLETVKRSIELAAACLHVEVTTLIVPGLNDDATHIEQLAAWLASIDPAIPLHLTRFHPAHRMLDTAPTPHSTIHKLVAVAARHLKWVYPGNM